MLISLAVIFVPMMFDQPHDERAVRSLDIPEEPPFPEVSVPEDDDQLNGVPDYRVEEVEPAPTPEVVEDPAMGTQPRDTGDESAVAPDREVPLVGEQDDSEPGTDPAAEDSEPSGQAEEEPAPVDTAAGDSGPDQGSGSESADFDRSLEGAWVLQLGSFGSKDNARGLRDRVRERGYGAHLQEVQRGDQRLVRVFSGPFAEKEEAEKAKEVLDEAFGVQSLVTRGDG